MNKGMSQSDYFELAKRRRAKIEEALKIGDIITIDEGRFQGRHAAFLGFHPFGRDWMPFFDVIVPGETRKRQHFGPKTILRILGIEDG